MFCTDRLGYAYALLLRQVPALMAFELGLVVGVCLFAVMFPPKRGVR